MPKASSSPKQRKPAAPSGIRAADRTRGHVGTLALRTPVERIHVIHTAIASGSMPNCGNLAEMLDVTTKTVQRDINFMRDELGLPINYEGTKHGFHYKKPVGEFPVLDLNAEELATLFLTRAALVPLQGTKLAETLSVAFQRVARPLQDRVSFAWSDLDAAFATAVPGVSESEIEVFPKLAQAILDRKEADIAVKKSAADKAESRQVQPLHLGEVSGAWYLVAKDSTSGLVRVTPLAKVAKVKVLAAKFKRPEGFDARVHLATGFALSSGDAKAESFEVKVQAEGTAAKIAGERLWDASQDIKDLNAKGTRVEVKLTASNLSEATRWVLSLGGQAKVLAPAALVKAVREETKLIQQNAK